ncbi:hypothetical protein HMPREF3214_00602 [Alloscardovia omnicolens]|nr:hypothetical protein HMPREF3214_00602 [Alloscardovia omnicolens]
MSKSEVREFWLTGFRAQDGFTGWAGFTGWYVLVRLRSAAL